MRTTQQFSVTLPNEMAEMVKAKVASGEYASESEVMRDGLRTLLVRDRVLEDWLQNEVVPTYDAMKAGEMKMLSGDEVRASLRAKRELRRAATK